MEYIVYIWIYKYTRYICKINSNKTCPWKVMVYTGLFPLIIKVNPAYFWKRNNISFSFFHYFHCILK